jgi:hypothetical protein
VICWLCGLLLQFNNPFHLWLLWDPEVREQRRCLARHNQMMGEKVRQLRKTPPAPHTIAGTSSFMVCNLTLLQVLRLGCATTSWGLLGGVLGSGLNHVTATHGVPLQVHRLTGTIPVKWVRLEPRTL